MNERNAITNETGSIMLEYVIALGAIGVAVLWFSNVLFFTGLTSDKATEWGPLGQQLVAFYQRTLGGISLPVP